MKLSFIKQAWAVFRAGQEVADPAKWKSHQVTANQVTVLLTAVVAILKGAGVDLRMDTETLAGVGIGVFAVVNWVLTVVTTRKIGFLGRPAQPAAAPAPAVDLAAPAVVGAPGRPAAPPAPPAAAAPRGQPAEPGDPDPMRTTSGA